MSSLVVVFGGGISNGNHRDGCESCVRFECLSAGFNIEVAHPARAKSLFRGDGEVDVAVRAMVLRAYPLRFFVFAEHEHGGRSGKPLARIGGAQLFEQGLRSDIEDAPRLTIDGRGGEAHAFADVFNRFRLGKLGKISAYGCARLAEIEEHVVEGK